MASEQYPPFGILDGYGGELRNGGAAIAQVGHWTIEHQQEASGLRSWVGKLEIEGGGPFAVWPGDHPLQMSLRTESEMALEGDVNIRRVNPFTESSITEVEIEGTGPIVLVPPDSRES
jgi:hypothetical protein